MHIFATSNPCLQSHFGGWAGSDEASWCSASIAAIRCASCLHDGADALASRKMGRDVAPGSGTTKATKSGCAIRILST